MKHRGSFHHSAPALRGALCALLLAPAATILARAETPGPEPSHGTKAELLFNIAKFIEWPANSFARHPNEFAFAILGEDELASVLASTMSTRSINGRQVFVRCVRRPEDARESQILFIAASEEKRMSEVVGALGGRSVLTVADSGTFAAQGGMVDFVMDESRVHFEINLNRVTRAKLKISAKLLALARIVEPMP